MNITARAFLSVLLLSAPLAFGQLRPGLKAQTTIETKQENLFGSMDHLSVGFSQTVFRKLRNKTFERSGQAFFSKPAKFRWVFEGTEADEEEYLFNGETLAHFQKKENLVTYYSTKTGLVNDLQEIVDLVLDSKKLLVRYDPKDVITEKNNSSFKLVPKIKNEIREIAVKISEERKYIKEVKIDYADGNYSLFRFRNPRLKEIDAKTYEFTNPGSVKIKKIG